MTELVCARCGLPILKGTLYVERKDGAPVHLGHTSETLANSIDQPQDASAKPKIFLICPVRNVKPEVQKQIEAYVAQLEQEGYGVYWPARDTDQSDPIGITICETNRAAIHRADAIHIWFDPQSQDSLFNIGMVFESLTHSKKRIVIANRHEVQRTPHKSFQNVLLELSLRTRA